MSLIGGTIAAVGRIAKKIAKSVAKAVAKNPALLTLPFESGQNSFQDYVLNPRAEFVRAITFVSYDEEGDVGELIEYFVNWPEVSGAIVYAEFPKNIYEEYKKGAKIQTLQHRLGQQSLGAWRSQNGGYNLENKLKNYEGAPLTEVNELLQSDNQIPQYVKGKYQALVDKRFPATTRKTSKTSRTLTRRKIGIIGGK